MPQPNESYNRFMKFMGFNEKQKWDWKLQCEICFKLKYRNAELELVKGQLICKDKDTCLNGN